MIDRGCTYSCSEDGWNCRTVCMAVLLLGGWKQVTPGHYGSSKAGWGWRRLHHQVAIYSNPDPQWGQPPLFKKKHTSGPARQLRQSHVHICHSAPSYSGICSSLQHTGFKTRALADILITTRTHHTMSMLGSVSSRQSWTLDTLVCFNYP